MSYTLQQIFEAPDEAIYPILTQLNLKIGEDPIENRIKLARVYAESNMINPKEKTLLYLENFDTAIKTYGFTNGIKLLSNPQITLKELWEVSNADVTKFLLQQKLPLSNDGANRATLIKFYADHHMLPREELVLTKNPQFYSYVQVGWPLNQIISKFKLATVSLKGIWSTPADKIKMILMSQGIVSTDDDISNRMKVARLYAAEGRLSETDTKLVNGYNFDKVVAKASDFTKTYTTTVKKTLLNQVLPADIGSIIEGYAGIAVQPEYMFIIAKDNTILVLDLNNLANTKIIAGFKAPPERMVYSNGLLIVGAGSARDSEIFYINLSDAHLTPMFISNGTSINVYNNQLFLKKYGSIIVDIYDLNTGVPVEIGQFNIDCQRLNMILTLNNLYYVIEPTKISVYDLDTKDLIYSKPISIAIDGVDVDNFNGGAIVGDFIVLYKTIEPVLWFIDRHNFKLVKTLDLDKKVYKLFVDGSKLYVSLDYNKDTVVINPTVSFDVKPLQQYQKGRNLVEIMSVHNNKVYYCLSNHKDSGNIVEINLINSDIRSVNADMRLALGQYVLFG